MIEKKINCPICGGSFEPGFIIDFGYWRFSYVSRWVEGEPKMMFSGVPRFSDRTSRFIEAKRCNGCGYLSLFANKDVKQR